ncbi:major facilitator superfamily domain-containing protein, partial [Mycena olivaceomarginata]
LPEDKTGWEDDPENPRNWSTGTKWASAGVVSFYTFVSPFSSSIMGPGLPAIAVKYRIANDTITAMTLSIFLLSFAIGVSSVLIQKEMYGRYVLNLGNIFAVGFTLGCAFAPNTAALLVFRFLAGFSGSAPIACGGGVIGDLFSERDRAAAMAIYSLGPLIGPAAGPVIGGFVTEAIGVKYVFIIAACELYIRSYIVGIPLLRETYAPYLRLRKAELATDPEKAARAHPVESRLQYLWLNLVK